MKITILGSGPCTAIPRRACKCPTCRDARRSGSKSRRTRSSLIIEKRGFNLLIDCGPDFLLQLKREKIKKIDTVILTHLHADAAGGLNKLGGWSEAAVPVYSESINFKKIKKTKKLLLREIKIGSRKSIGPFKVVAYRVRHGLTPGFPTVGYIIDNKLGYISDVGEIPKSNLKYFKNLDVLFLDAALWFGKGMKGHLNAGQAIALGKILRPKKLILTQIGHGYPPYERARREIARQAHTTGFAGQVVLGFDGLRV
ncbi:MAG: MBL fold metallo-hydrolase [Patescibacteria group bacterium]|nr:MBL fold metallo-hydrolase [Patescibacteria group bacterium]